MTPDDLQREMRALRRDFLIAIGAIVVWAVVGIIGLIWLITRS